jgi:voltage-gated potassium channel
MFELIARLCRKSLFKLYEHTWIVIAISLCLLYVGGWIVMHWANETAIINNYAWWFIVTITTVGYGDFAPTSSAGRIAASIIMLVGIGVIGLVIGKFAEIILDTANRKQKGLSRMKLKDHTIIFGYRRGSTEKMVKELLADNPDEAIVVCSNEQKSNPLLKYKVHFVQGELASHDVLERSNAQFARNVIIHGQDDNQTFFTAYAFREINTSAHMVCCLMNEDHVEKIKKLPAQDRSLNQIILPANIYLMAQELQDHESCAVVQNLISNLTGENMYRFDIPAEMKLNTSFKELFIRLKEAYGVTVIALKDNSIHLNPGLDHRVCSGMSFFYVAPKRLENIDVLLR